MTDGIPYFHALCLLLFLFAGNCMLSQTTYYVSTSGNNSNTGLAPANAWQTITYAASSAAPVVPGDTVYIQAGNYGTENVVFETSGTSSKPIYFIGFQNKPGDLSANTWSYGDTLSASHMPLLNGGDRTSGTSITLHNRQFVHIENFQITNYKTGVYAYNTHFVTVKNIRCDKLGDTLASYEGRGIVFGSLSDNNVIDNCMVLNACAEGISIIGDSNKVSNCRVYADDNTTGVKSAMDYYLLVNGNHNKILGCHVERVGNLDHGGHGITIKGEGEENLIKNCTAKGFALAGFNVRHRKVKYNTFAHCTAIHCGFGVRDGASFNTFSSCQTDSATNGVLFYDTSEDGGAQYAGRHNRFENCIFRHTNENVINYFYYSLTSPCDSNTFVNCLVDGGNYLFNVDRKNAGNELVNSIVTNVQHFSRTANQQDSSYPLDVNISHSLFWNNGFAPPAGTHIYETDPRFASIGTGDYHLAPNSPCIDTGRIKDAPPLDFDSTARPQGSGVDLGPFEYVFPSGTKQNSSTTKKVVAYPNPTGNHIFVQNRTGNINSWQLYDLFGRNVTDQISGQQTTPSILDLDLRPLNEGVYLLKIEGASIKILLTNN